MDAEDLLGRLEMADTAWCGTKDEDRLLTIQVARAHWATQTIEVVVAAGFLGDIKETLKTKLDLDCVEVDEKGDFDSDYDGPTHEIAADGKVITLPDGEYFERGWFE